MKYTEHITLLHSHQGKKEPSDAKCWEQIDAQRGQILLQMPVLSNSAYSTAKHLDGGFLEMRRTLLGFKHAFLGLSYKVCSLKTLVKLVFVTQLKPEQEREKTKQRRQRFYIAVSLFAITLTSDSYSQRLPRTSNHQTQQANPAPCRKDGSLARSSSI